MFDVVTIGTATRDVFLQSPLFKVLKDPEHLRKIGFVEGVAECFAFGGKTDVGDPVFTIGGGAANTAVTFSRQGLKTAAYLALGKDDSGAQIEKALKQEGVHPFITFSKKATGYSTILLSSQGERTILVSRGAANDVTFQPKIVKQLAARWVYITPGAIPKNVIERLMSSFKKNGSKIAINLSGHYVRMGAPALKTILGHTDVLIVNRSEAATLTQSSYESSEKTLLSKMGRYVHGLVVMTDGPKGSYVGDGTYMYHAGIFPEKKLIDRTGAGDAFGSGFVAGLLTKGSTSGVAIEYALRLGSANATTVVEAIGAEPGILTKRQFERLDRFGKLTIHKMLL